MVDPLRNRKIVLGVITAILITLYITRDHSPPSFPEKSEADNTCERTGRSIECWEARRAEQRQAEMVRELDEAGFFQPDMKKR